MRAVLFFAAILQALLVADAEAAPRAKRGAAPPLGEIVVTGRVKCLPAAKEADMSPPKLVSSFPAPDAVIRPGLVVVRATFDRPMTCSGFFRDAPPFPSPCDVHMQKMVMSYDRR